MRLSDTVWLRNVRRGVLPLAVAAVLLTCGCGNGDDTSEAEAPPPDDAAMAEGAAPPVDDASMPPPDPAMAEAMPGGMPPDGMVPGGMPGQADPAAPAPIAVAVAPQYPTRGNPFGALDNPTRPEPPPPILPPPPTSQQLMPIRATVEVTLPSTVDDAPRDDRLPDVRTSGILWGPTVKAIVQYRDAAGAEQSAVVKPGDVLPIRSPGGTSVTVQSIGPEGVQLQNEQTRRVYFAPLEGR